jgi:hypothetical protein
VFVVAPELAGQEFVARASVGAGVRQVTFELDGVALGVIGEGRPAVFVVPLRAGAHTLRVLAELSDGTVATATASYQVNSR